MSKKLLILLFILILFSVNLYAHGGDESDDGLRKIVDYSLKMVYVSSIIMILITLVSIYSFKKLKSWQKSFYFWIISIPVILATIGIVGSTIYLNFVSPTHGPVHWHADFEINICGKNFELKDPRGLSNRIGTPLLHEHNDNRIHVEGTPLDLRDIDLTSFFNAVGGDLTGERLEFPSNNGMIRIKKGDVCFDKPARLMIFVEKQEGNNRRWIIAENMGEYVLAGYSTIPPGDRIKIIFSEKDENEIMNMINKGEI